MISAPHQGLMPASPTTGASVLPYPFGLFLIEMTRPEAKNRQKAPQAFF